MRDIGDERCLLLRFAPLAPRVQDKDQCTRGRQRQQEQHRDGRSRKRRANTFDSSWRTGPPQGERPVGQHRGKLENGVGPFLLRRLARLEERAARTVAHFENESVACGIGENGRELREKRNRLQFRADHASVRRPAPSDERQPVALEPRFPGEERPCRVLEAFVEERHVPREETPLLLRRAALLRKHDAASGNPSKRVPDIRLAPRELGERGVGRIRRGRGDGGLGGVLRPLDARGKPGRDGAFDNPRVRAFSRLGELLDVAHNPVGHHAHENDGGQCEQHKCDWNVEAALHRFTSSSAG